MHFLPRAMRRFLHDSALAGK